MEIVTIQSTKSTPDVLLDAEQRLVRITGQSYPENAFKFYEEILDWVDQYLESHGAGALTRVELNLPYINTSSTKCLMMLLEKFEDAHQAGKPVQVTWQYDSENESELECAEEFKEDLSLPFEIVASEA